MRELTKEQREVYDYYKVFFSLKPNDLTKKQIDERWQEFVVEFYPGRDNLTGEELIMEKYFNDDVHFIEFIAKKHFMEIYEIGSAFFVEGGVASGFRGFVK